MASGRWAKTGIAGELPGGCSLESSRTGSEHAGRYLATPVRLLGESHRSRHTTICRHSKLGRGYAEAHMPSFSELADRHRSRFEDDLFEFLRIPSISTLPDHRRDIARAARFTMNQLVAAGLESVEVIEGSGHPLVYGEWLGAPGKPTILCYGHYDVQPVDPIGEWKSPPFEPTVRDGQVYARGASDDKGQVLANIKAIESLHRSRGSLPVNVKFLIEGEEEVGGTMIAAYVKSHRGKLAADAALVSDTAMYLPETPTICTGLRGLMYTEWIATGAERDLHSGLYGGVAPNAVFGLVELLAQCKDASGRVLIPGFYDDVEEPSEEELRSWNRLPFDENTYLSTEVRASALTGEPGFSVFERVGSRPTFEVHGISGGFTGPGAKTVIPAAAGAKVSARLVPRQDPHKILRLAQEFAASHAPPGISVEVRLVHSAPAILAATDHPVIDTAARALRDVWGRETVFVRSGGSIPVVGDFQDQLGIPTVLMGYGLPDDALHAPNEKFSLRNFHMGIASTGRFLELLGNQQT